MDFEEWRDIPGYDYGVSISSKEGKCINLKTGKILRNTVNKSSKRILWDLHNNGKRNCQQAARWIAITYPELVQNEYFDGAEIDQSTQTLWIIDPVI